MVAFRAPGRKPLNDVHYNDRDLPGPADYAGSVVKESPKKKGYGRPFAVNERRFQTIDHTSAPPVGTYEYPSSLVVKEPRLPAASMRSGAPRAPAEIIGKDNPGVGEYDTQHLKTIAATEFQGGAANNFALFTKSHQLSMKPVKIPEHGRFKEIKI